VGTPPSVRYFALDLESDGTTCAAGNPGYRCFQEKHRARRQMLLVGSNDGMLHAFDAGLPQDIDPDPVAVQVDFDNGTGSEIFAYAPRATLRTVRTLAEGSNHRWGGDGNPAAADVFIDPVHNGVPDPLDREWRSVVITGLREGGSAYFALDLTQPDLYDADGLAAPINTYVPSCMGNVTLVDDAGDLTANCGPTPFPAALWEFDDSVLDTTVAPTEYRLLDEDMNGVGDLGDTWSTPTIGMVELCEGAGCDPLVEPNDIVRKHVAVFGGGMDPADKINPQRGNWVYIVDIETGQTIYKRQVEGAVAGNTAAVDTDQNGVLDRIYLARPSAALSTA
jgi:Tfp pilus tip-associated adhesin PilY1